MFFLLFYNSVNHYIFSTNRDDFFQTHFLSIGFGEVSSFFHQTVVSTLLKYVQIKNSIHILFINIEQCFLLSNFISLEVLLVHIRFDFLNPQYFRMHRRNHIHCQVITKFNEVLVNKVHLVFICNYNCFRQVLDKLRLFNFCVNAGLHVLNDVFADVVSLNYYVGAYKKNGVENHD